MRDWEARLLPAWGLLAVVGLLSAGTVEAQAFPPQYANALSRTEYTIFTGDINGDQLPDVLAKAKTRIVVVDIDVFIPIVLKPVSGGFITAVLIANSQGIFARSVNDADDIMVAWRSFCTSLDAGDVNSAARFITVDGQSIYVPVLQGLGAALTGVTVSWSQPKAISVGDKVALYGMRDNTGGANELHTLLFMREDGRWLLSAF